MRARQERPPSGSLTLFVAGAAVGAALALLLAPESGEESRKKIGRWLHESRADDVLVKLKKMLTLRHNGRGAHVNGRAEDRRHGRSV